MKTLKQLWEENGFKGGFWINNKPTHKTYVHGESPTEAGWFAVEFYDKSTALWEGDMPAELYAPPKPKTKMLAYIDGTTGHVSLLEENTTTHSMERRAAWLDGEFE